MIKSPENRLEKIKDVGQKGKNFWNSLWLFGSNKESLQSDSENSYCQVFYKHKIPHM